MRCISKETNIAYFLSSSVFAFIIIDSNSSLWLLSIPVLYYAIIWLIIKIFVWDKKEFVITLRGGFYKKHEILNYGNRQCIILKTLKRYSSNSDYNLAVYPINKKSNIRWIKLSYKIRNLF